MNRHPVVRVPLTKNAKKSLDERARALRKAGKISAGSVVIDKYNEDVGLVAKVEDEKIYCWWAKTYEGCLKKKGKNPEAKTLADGWKKKTRAAWVISTCVKLIR